MMIPRHILLALILVYAAGMARTQGTWEMISLPTTQNLNSVFFADSLHGWIAGDSGVILHTADGGATWAFQQTNALHHVECLFFLDQDRGWASTFNFTTMPFGTILLKTTDGGQHWTSQSYPASDIFINCILFRDTLNGWMGGSPHALVRTTDGGATWTQAAIAPGTLASFPVLCIKFYDDRYGYASGGRFDIAGVTWHTSDGGNFWYPINPLQAPADEVHELHIFDSITVMGAGGDPDFGYGVGMIRTFDGGNNWIYDELSMQGNAVDLDFRTASEAWAPLGVRQKLIYSLDTGNTWTEIPTPGQSVIVQMTFSDSLHGWAVGRNGVALKYRPPLHPGLAAEGPAPGRILLCQNHPNPVTGYTVISYTIPADKLPADPVIRIYDILGCEVSCLPLQDRTPGGHNIRFDASAIPGGMYLYRLEYSNQDGRPCTSPFRKMIIIQ